MEHTQEFSSHNTLETCGSNVNGLVMKDKFTLSKKIDKYSVLIILIKINSEPIRETSI